MDAAQTLTDLIDAARRAQASALHIVRKSGRDMVYARFPAGLIFARHAPSGSTWFDQARRHSGATAIADRVVIAIADATRTGNALDALGMPGRMWRTIEAMDGPPGGALVVASRDAGARRKVMAALGRPGEDRYVPWVEPLSDRIDTAARMDCDAILIDGIADRATATLAFNVAHAGRRVVIGIDAIDSIGAIAVLRTLRVERHMLGSALRAVVAVRPAPGLCTGCHISDQTSASESALLGLDPGTVIYRAAGCGACDGTGYAQPVMVFETVAVDAPLRRLLVEGADATIIARHAFLMSPSLAGSARVLLRQGAIPADAAIRVARESGVSAAIGTGHPHILSSASSGLTIQPYPR